MHLPGYELFEELGRGGMGVVYRGRHVALNRFVAVKTILAGVAATAADVARFRREAEAFARLDHPHIVRVFDCGDAGGLPFFVMEFVPGGTLRQAMAAGPVAFPRAATLISQLAHAVQHAHDRGVLHRDLKPGNVLLTADGQPKVSDFGLAKWLDGPSDLTATGAVLGTVAYMAPEQADGLRAGPAADVYALGAVLYELLTGRPPFAAAGLFALLDMVRTAAPVPPEQLRPGVPPHLNAACLRCLAKDPAARITVAELAVAVGGADTPNCGTTHTDPPTPREQWWRA